MRLGYTRRNQIFNGRIIINLGAASPPHKTPKIMINKQDTINALKAMAEPTTEITITAEIRNEENKATIYAFCFDAKSGETTICVVYDDDDLIFTPRDWQGRYAFDSEDDIINAISNYEWMAYSPQDCEITDMVAVMDGLPRLLML